MHIPTYLLPSPMVCVVGFVYLFRLILVYVVCTYILSSKCRCTRGPGEINFFFAFLYSIQSDDSKIFSYIPNSIKKSFVQKVSLSYFPASFRKSIHHQSGLKSRKKCKIIKPHRYLGLFVI